MAKIIKEEGTYWRGYDAHWSIITNFHEEEKESFKVSDRRAKRIIWQKAKRLLARGYGWEVDDEHSSEDDVYIIIKQWSDGVGCPDHEEGGTYVRFSVKED